MKTMQTMLGRGAAVAAGLAASAAFAANVAVTNVELLTTAPRDGYAGVRFDVQWDASWRASWTETGVTPNVTVTNWDAAWLFVKFRNPAGAGGQWDHATLSTNAGDHLAPAGAAIEVGLSTNAAGAKFGAGVFLYRSAEGAGPWTNKGVTLRWRYPDDGVARADRVDVSVHAIEMVYVPRGAFWLGDGATNKIHAQFEDGTNGTPFRVTNDYYEITLGGTNNGNLGNRNKLGQEGGGWSDDFMIVGPKTLPAAFPKGFNAFYCMKHELSQGQYADFLNHLTYMQATNRYPDKNGADRHTIGGTHSAYTATAPTRACNYISWADGMAYADWAGLRPMTELEFEKACRGPLYPVSNEYAWGTTAYTNRTGYSGTGGLDGSGTETATPATANCVFSSGPTRCGLFATSVSDRQGAGASYWGILDMSGNLMERLVSVGGTVGRGFTDVHGDGTLTVSGEVSVVSWPPLNGGGCLRDGYWNYYAPAEYCQVSQRAMGYYGYGAGLRHATSGFRFVRSAPAANP